MNSGPGRALPALSPGVRGQRQTQKESLKKRKFRVLQAGFPQELTPRVGGSREVILSREPTNYTYLLSLKRQGV